MGQSVIIIIVGVICIVVGARKSVLAGMFGLVLLPVFVFLFISKKIFVLLLGALFGLGFGYGIGLISTIFFSGMKGGGHNTGPSYMGGFGGGRGGTPAGGIILSDEERERLKK